MRQTKLNNTDGFKFKGWMVNVLQLKGGDLFAFALIYQFVQSIAGIYKGNTAYLSAWTGWSERTSRAHLKSLQERGLIIEVRGRENNSPYCYYQLGPAFNEAVKSTPQIMQGEGEKKASYTQQKCADAPSKNCKENKQVEGTSECIPPTPKEVANFVRGRGWVNPNGFGDYFVAYYANPDRNWCASDGSKIRDWKGLVISWELDNKDRTTFPTPKAPASHPVASLHQITDEEFDAFIKQ